jgi:hypothetical protein
MGTVQVFAGLVTGPTAFSGIQSVSMRKGRINLTDNYSTGSVTITGVNPSSLPTITIGDMIYTTISYTPPSGPSFSNGNSFRVTNVTIEYGIVPNEDTWTITGEDAFGEAGRATFSRTFSAGSLTVTAATAIGTDVSVPVLVVSSLPDGVTMSGQTFTNENALQVITNLSNTGAGSLWAISDSIYWYPRNWQTEVVYYNFTDTGTGTKPVKYDRVQFAALADTAVTKVIVEPSGLAAQSSGTGNNVFSIQTYNETTTEAANLAAYFAGSLSVVTPKPIQISVLLNNQANTDALAALSALSGINLTFRGSVYKTIVLGYSVTSTPEATRFSYNVISADFFRYLILNDPVFGTLDNNRLGY